MEPRKLIDKYIAEANSYERMSRLPWRAQAHFHPRRSRAKKKTSRRRYDWIRQKVISGAFSRQQGITAEGRLLKPHHGFSLSIPRILLSAVSIMSAFALLFWLTKSIGGYGGRPLALPDYVIFSVRSFITFSTPDIGPVNSIGSFLSSMEGMMGMCSVILFSFLMGQKLGGSGS